jgi:hypothetical protein
LRDELSGWVQALNSYKGGKGSDRQFFLTVWSGTPSSVDRKSQDAPTFLDKPFLAITGTIQPDVVQAFLHESRWDDGFIDRILFAYPEVQIANSWTEDEVFSATTEAVEELFLRLYGLDFNPDEPHVVVLDPEAKRLWVEWYESNQRELKEIEENIRGVWAKMPSQCARLILIAHLTRWAAGETPDGDIVDRHSLVGRIF